MMLLDSILKLRRQVKTILLPVSELQMWQQCRRRRKLSVVAFGSCENKSLPNLSH